MIVEFIGLPGVGKTTLSRSVAVDLKSREISVYHPNYKCDIYSTPRRVTSKARFVIQNLRTNPRLSLTMMQKVVQSGQKSLDDFARVLFNIYYILGLTNSFDSRSGITLLDQGIYQARWSVGLQSTQPIAEVIKRVDIPKNLAPDLVVFVEATDATIANRLTNRTDGDTRFAPNSEAFKRARDGYESIKSQIETAPDGPNSITIENETQESLKPNAAHIADVIQSLDK